MYVNISRPHPRGAAEVSGRPHKGVGASAVTYFQRLRCLSSAARTTLAMAGGTALPPLGTFDLEPEAVEVTAESADAARWCSLWRETTPPRWSNVNSQCNSPFIDDVFTVTVKRTAGGYASNWLCDNAHRGLRLHSLAPAGTFFPKSLDTDFLLLAGGSGITPIMAILESALSQSNGRTAQIYAARRCCERATARTAAPLTCRANPIHHGGQLAANWIGRHHRPIELAIPLPALTRGRYWSARRTARYAT